MECTKVNCPMQAGTPTDNCGDSCPWRTTVKLDDLISRAAAIEAMKRAAYWNDAERKITELPAVDAIPVEWLRDFDLYYAGISGGTPYMNALLEAWKGQEVE